MATGTIILPAQSPKLPTSNPARIDGSLVNWQLRFSPTTSQSAWWIFRLPANYASNPVLKIQFVCTVTQSGTNGVLWGVYVEAVAPTNDIGTDSYGSVNSATATLTANQAANLLSEVPVTLTNIGGTLTPGNFVKIKVIRNVPNGSDTATNDVSLVACSLEYTTT
jgi:hypothetical protein